MRRIYSKKNDLVANVWKLKDWFRESGCPEDTVNKETKRALETPSLGCSKTSLVNGETEVALVVNYNLFLSRLGHVIGKSVWSTYFV